MEGDERMVACSLLVESGVIREFDVARDGGAGLARGILKKFARFHNGEHNEKEPKQLEKF